MKTRKIGSLDVSVVGLGTNNFGKRIDQARSSSVISAALDAGVNFIDTADVYGGTQSEVFIGNALKNRRDEVVLATKFGVKIDGDHLGGANPDYVRTAAEESLRRLQTDRIDLFIVHRPDPVTPIAITLEALDNLVQAGKVTEIGCSNFSLEQLREAHAVSATGGPRFVNLQSEFNLLQRGVAQAVLPECARIGIGFVPYAPLAGGFLTGKYHRSEPLVEGSRLTEMSEEKRAAELTDEKFDVVEALTLFCEEQDHSLLDLAVSWLLAQTAVASVIAGASTPEQVRANVGAASWQLTDEDLKDVNQILATS